MNELQAAIDLETQAWVCMIKFDKLHDNRTDLERMNRIKNKLNQRFWRRSDKAKALVK